MVPELGRKATFFFFLPSFLHCGVSNRPHVSFVFLSQVVTLCLRAAGRVKGGGMGGLLPYGVRSGRKFSFIYCPSRGCTWGGMFFFFLVL